MARPRSATWSDLALAALLVIFARFGTGPAAQNQGMTAPPAAYVLAMLAAAAMVLWHVRPLWTVAVVGTACAVYLAAGFAYGPILVTLALAMYGVCAWTSQRLGLIAAGSALGAGMVAVGIAVAAGAHDWTAFVSVAAWFVLPAALGTVVRIRRDAAARVRSEQGRRAVSEERLRLAQEVHDVAGHGFAVIAMQAGVGLRVIDRDPDAAKAALRAIRAASIEALDSLRGEVWALRQGPDQASAPLRTHTGLGDLAALADRMRSSGLPVTLDVAGDTDGLPDDVDRAAYRIVQESLTNVLRHGGPAVTATVRVRRSPDLLEVDVVDTGTGADISSATGTGIDGMRRRAEALGGTLTAGPEPGGGFAVHAQLPLPPSGGHA